MQQKSTLLLDIDGVLNHADRFSTRYAKVFNIPPERLTSFFTGRFELCITGKADLRQELATILSDWEWRGSVDDLLKWWFEGEVQFDMQMISYVRNFKKKGIYVYAASNQERLRAQHLFSLPPLQTLFERVFLSCDVGVTKSDTQFFTHVLTELSIPAQQVIFFDDDPINIHTANRLGIHAYLYRNYGEFKKIIEESFTS